MTVKMNEVRRYNLENVSIRLVKEASVFKTYRHLDCPEKVVDTLYDFVSSLDREVCMVVNLDNKGRPINYNLASIGTLDSALVVPRELLKAGILSNAASMIMIHQHPSGNPEPSSHDDEITSRMKYAGDIIGIRLIDHIIIGEPWDNFYSYNEHGRILNEKINYDIQRKFDKMINEERNKSL